MREVKDRFNFYMGRVSELKSGLRNNERDLEQLQRELAYTKEARDVLLVAAQVAQRTAKQKVEALVTAAIRSVYDRSFSFKLKFKQQRNKSTVEPVVIEGDTEYNAKEDLGGGMIDIISFALRLVIWSMRTHRTRQTMILDEPMKFVGKGELLERGAQFIKNVSQRLGVQFIILTHEPQLAEIADKAWKVTHVNGKSVVEEV